MTFVPTALWGKGRASHGRAAKREGRPVHRGHHDGPYKKLASYAARITALLEKPALKNKQDVNRLSRRTHRKHLQPHPRIIKSLDFAECANGRPGLRHQTKTSALPQIQSLTALLNRVGMEISKGRTPELPRRIRKSWSAPLTHLKTAK